MTPYGLGPGAQGPTKLIIKSKYLENVFDAVIVTVLESIARKYLKNLFDAVIIKMLINMFVYI